MSALNAGTAALALQRVIANKMAQHQYAQYLFVHFVRVLPYLASLVLTVCTTSGDTV